MATTKTRILTATFPDGTTFWKEIKVTKSLSCDYDFAVGYFYQGAWHVDGLSRYEKVAAAEAAEKRSRGIEAVVLALESVVL